MNNLCDFRCCSAVAAALVVFHLVRRLGVVVVPPHVERDVASQFDDLEAHDDSHAQIEAQRAAQTGEEALGLKLSR